MDKIINMTEQEFSDRLLQEAKEALDESKYVVKAKYNLFYELCLNDKGELLQELDEPARGSSAFQADIVVFEKDSVTYPRIVIELKAKIQHTT